MSGPVPILLISDAPSSGTGLGRITGDLASRLHEHVGDLYRVGVLGYGGPGSRKFKFQQYGIEGMTDWVVPALPQVWEDFAGDQPGICMPVWDLSRLMWFAQPARCDLLGAAPALREWLVNAPFRRFGYFPIDADGPKNKLSFPLHQTLLGFERVLAYGKWAESVIERTVEEDGGGRRIKLGHLPHGIDTEVFHRRDREQSRLKFASTTGALTLMRGPQLASIAHGEVLIGIVATNQARKDWALAMATVSLLAQNHRVRLWIHTDTLERHWSIPALLADYGLLQKGMISVGYLSDDAMAQAYTACDVTLGIGLGEGMGYPIFESLACGTPCIHGNYGGAPEWMDEEFLVPPAAFRAEGLYSSTRPVFKAEDFAAKVEQALRRSTPATLNPELDWANLWPNWEAWFREAA